MSYFYWEWFISRALAEDVSSDLNRINSESDDNNENEEENQVLFTKKHISKKIILTIDDGPSRFSVFYSWWAR